MKILFSKLFFLLQVLAITVSASLTSCQTDQTQVADFPTAKERDTLLVNMITYMGPKAPGATSKTRFSPQFRPFYVKQLPKYKLLEYTVTPDSTYYYFIIRPVGEGKLFKRGVGGKFKLKENQSLVDFEEMWCTPHFKDDSTIKERGGFLFSAMVKEGNVNKYLTMKHYVEWPDSTLRYDKQLHEWISTGIRL